MGGDQEECAEGLEERAVPCVCIERLWGFHRRGCSLTGQPVAFTWLVVELLAEPVVVSVQSLSCVRLSATPWTAARQASLSITNSRSLPILMSLESVMPSNHLILCRPFSCLQSFPASVSFPMSWLFTSGGQNIGASASASVLPMNI